MKLKNKLAGLLSLSLLLGVLTVSSSAIDRENDVEFVLEMVTRTPGSEYAWNTDGGRETKIVSNKVRERVWGWSTCYDKYEKESRIKGWRRIRRSAQSLLPAVRAVDGGFSAVGCGAF